MRNVFLSLGSPDGASVLLPPERQRGSYFWVSHWPSPTAVPCIIYSAGHKAQRVMGSRGGTREYCSALSYKYLLVIEWWKLLFVLLYVHHIWLILLRLTGKSGMYFVEDNAADAHDNQVKPKFSVQFLFYCLSERWHCTMWVCLAAQPRMCLCLNRVFMGRPRHHLSLGLTRRSRRCTNAGGSSETTLWRYSSPMEGPCC